MLSELDTFVYALSKGSISISSFGNLYGAIASGMSRSPSHRTKCTDDELLLFIARTGTAGGAEAASWGQGVTPETYRGSLCHKARVVGPTRGKPANYGVIEFPCS